MTGRICCVRFVASSRQSSEPDDVGATGSCRQVAEVDSMRCVTDMLEAVPPDKLGLRQKGFDRALQAFI
jgi:hypothetical protein